MQLGLIVAVLCISSSLAAAQEAGATKATDSPKRSSIFDEFKEPPDFTHLPEDERRDALRKWQDENIGDPLVSNMYINFMKRLRREAKKPGKDSRYSGIWRISGEKRNVLVLAGDGSFTWDYGHSSGVGIWREHEEGIMWIGFAHVEKDKDGKEKTWYAQHFCYLKDDETLVQDHIDYTATYKRTKAAETKGKSGGEQDGARQPATAPDSKSEGSEKPKPETGERSQ